MEEKHRCVYVAAFFSFLISLPAQKILPFEYGVEKIYLWHFVTLIPNDISQNPKHKKGDIQI